MEKTEYLPIGSIVLLKDGVSKAMIVSRGLAVPNGGRRLFFDYAAVAYPEGLISDQVAYFNSDNISKVVFKGYSDIDDENAVENIYRFIEAHPEMEKGNQDNWVSE